MAKKYRGAMKTRRVLRRPQRNGVVRMVLASMRGRLLKGMPKMAKGPGKRGSKIEYGPLKKGPPVPGTTGFV